MPSRNFPVSRRHALTALLSASLAPLGAAAWPGVARTQPAPPPVAAATTLGVRVRNQSTAPTCSGPENVALTLVSAQVRQLRIEARHPAYVLALAADRAAPAYLGCPPQPSPAAKAEAPPPVRRTTLYETPDLAMVGYVLPDVWRRADVPVRVGEVPTSGLDKIELWVKQGDRAATVLELFCGDGSWRLRPLPPPHLPSTAFGASVLIGPVAQEEKLLVKLKAIGFAPQARAFTLHFADGGRARVRLAGLDTDSLVLEAEFTQGLEAPFAALRARYATQSEADITRLAWRTSATSAFGEAPVMEFTDARDVTLLWAGRLAPARPALSAPDLVFTGFAGA